MLVEGDLQIDHVERKTESISVKPLSVVDRIKARGMHGLMAALLFIACPGDDIREQLEKEHKENNLTPVF